MWDVMVSIYIIIIIRVWCISVEVIRIVPERRVSDFKVWFVRASESVEGLLFCFFFPESYQVPTRYEQQ